VCEHISVNKDFLEEQANLRWVTSDRHRHNGAAAGFYLVVTLSQLHYITNLGWLLTMTEMQAIKVCLPNNVVSN
jgi:hypothetical protein